MAEQQPRKKLSLGRKTLSTNRTTISSNLKTKLQEKKESNISTFFKKAPKEISKLYTERQKVCEQITQIEQRLLFAKSEPLQEFLFELKTKDFEEFQKY
jgi:hypothetical protein